MGIDTQEQEEVIPRRIEDIHYSALHSASGNQRVAGANCRVNDVLLLDNKPLKDMGSGLKRRCQTVASLPIVDHAGTIGGPNEIHLRLID